MIRYLFSILIFFAFVLKAQERIVLIDSSFSYFYIDESTPLPFSPDISFKFGIPDSAHITVEVHKILSDTNDSEIIQTVPIITILDKTLSKGKYQVWWDGKDSNGNKLDSIEKYIYYLSANRKVKTINGIGYIKIEAKSKITSP